MRVINADRLMDQLSNDKSMECGGYSLEQLEAIADYCERIMSVVEACTVEMDAESFKQLGDKHEGFILRPDRAEV